MLSMCIKIRYAYVWGGAQNGGQFSKLSFSEEVDTTALLSLG